MKILLTISLTLIACISHAQDIHFSQFFAAPLTLNPAQTGNFPDQFRVGGNFKNQWPWGSQLSNYTYRTYSAYTDFAMMRERLPKGDWLGFGLVMVKDVAGDGDLSFFKMKASLAYHKSLDAFDKYHLSAGFGAGFVQRKIDFEKLYFNSQWHEVKFDNSLPSGEQPVGDKFGYWDINAGILFSMSPNLKNHYYIGASVYHINQPKESFYDGDNQLGLRPVFNAGGNIVLNKKFSLHPSAIYMSQKKASEILASALVGYSPKTLAAYHSTIFFGAIYRNFDALIPVAGYQYKTIRVLVNYDLNLSQLTVASRAVGGFEMSVVYTGSFPKRPPAVQIPCPRI